MIKNIIFDLGGVILNIDYNLTAQSFKNLGIANFDEIYSQSSQTNLFDKMEKGLMSPREFRDAIRSVSGIQLSDFDIDKAWNAMLLDLPGERIELLLNLKQNYRTFLLSNTNSIHYDAYTANLREEKGIDGLAPLFEKEYFSHLVGMKKPDAEIFLHVLNDAGLDIEETIFIDDSIQHVEGARKVGLNAIHLDVKSGASVMDLFTNNMLNIK